MNIVTDAAGRVVMSSVGGSPTPPDGGQVEPLTDEQAAAYEAAAAASPLGVRFVNGAFEPIGVDLSVQKAQKLAGVAAQLARRNATGFTYAGKTYQLDDASQDRITALVVKADRYTRSLPGSTWDGRFIAADNSQVSFTADAFGAFADAASNIVIQRRLHARDLKNLILAAADQATLDAIDITQGWA